MPSAWNSTVGSVGAIFNPAPSPTYTSVPLDAGTQGLINTQTANASQSPDQIAGKMNQGVAAAGQQAMQTNEQAQQESAGMGTNPNMLQAIRNQYGAQAGQAISDITKNNQNNASITKANWLQQAAQGALAQQKVETQNYEMLTNAYNDAMMARAQVLSSVFSFGGKAAGMAMANGGKGGGTQNSFNTTGGDDITAGNIA